MFAKALLSQCSLDGPFKILTDQDMICPNLSNLGYGLPFFCSIVATSGYENSNSSFSYSFMLSLLDLYNPASLLCRCISYSITALVTETFKLSTIPTIGTFISLSANDKELSDTPSNSAPSTMAVSLV